MPPKPKSKTKPPAEPTDTLAAPPIIGHIEEMAKTASAIKKSIKNTRKSEDLNQANQLTKQEVPPSKSLEDAGLDFILELTRPIRVGRWHITDFVGEYIHVFFITEESYETTVWKNKVKAAITLFGMRKKVDLSDVMGKRVGYLPHLFEAESIPAILIMASGRMIHRGIPGSAVDKEFTKEDMQKIVKGVEAYQTGVLRSHAIDLAKKVKEWMMIANQRVMDSWETTQILMRYFMLLFRLVDEKLAKQAGGLPWTTRITKFVKSHKRGVGILIFILVVAAAIIGTLWWNANVILHPPGG